MSDHGRGGTVLNRTGVGPITEAPTLICGLAALAVRCAQEGDIVGRTMAAGLIPVAKVVMDALKATLADGHYGECLHGRRGGPPDDDSRLGGARCSSVCIQVRKAILVGGGR